MSASPNCKSYLQLLASMKVAVGDFYLLLGHDFQASALPKSLGRGERRQCYRNAAMLAMEHPELVYCEGYACPKDLIPVHHAWCVTPTGTVVDSTWDAPAEAEYFGIALNTAWLRTRIENQTCWGLLAECIPREWLGFAPDAYLDANWLPDAARLREFEAKRAEWTTPKAA